MNVTRTGGGLKALAAKLTAVASGAHRSAATAAYAAALAVIIKVNTANHVKSGTLQREMQIVIKAPGELELMGPTDYRTSYSYAHFLKWFQLRNGFRDAHLALAMKQYLGVLKRAL